MSRYIVNGGLFTSSYFEGVLADPKKVLHDLPEDGAQRLQTLLDLWERVRNQFMRADRTQLVPLPFDGLPEGFIPIRYSSEIEIEKVFITPILETILGYSVSSNRTLRLSSSIAGEVKSLNQRPDMVLFSDRAIRDHANLEAELQKKGTPNGIRFCHGAQFILDAKRFDKGVGADDPDVEKKRRTKKGRSVTTAIDDLHQVERYLRGYQKKWGILTNGRVWRLMRQGKVQEHVHFNLVIFLEDLRETGITTEALETFRLFWNLFGVPAVAGGVLDKIESESEADTRKVRDILREQAHKAVEAITNGFWRYPGNGYSETPSQAELDHLRELSLTFLYRLLFILKAEAQNLLPMETKLGAETPYAKILSTKAIFAQLCSLERTYRARVTAGFGALENLFRAIDQGNENTEIPAYNGGLFNPEIHKELSRLKLDDDTLYAILRGLIYQKENLEEPVPYADLDVRDLGDIYEGLLEQRLTLKIDANQLSYLELVNQKGERKASGSYYTPDSLVDHLVRKTVNPLLEACDDDPEKILALKVLDPAMGSGHFLVKAVDVLAAYLTTHCDPVDEGAPADNGPGEMAYWKRKVAENCIYGVDYNPMSVELAKVALWLYTAQKDKPLSFLDHHLKCGNSLIGVSLEDLSTLGLQLKETKKGYSWVDVKTAQKRKKRADDLNLPFPINHTFFGELRSFIGKTLNKPSDRPEDIKAKRLAYEESVSRQLAAHRLLADLWCAQWFLVEPDKATSIDFGNFYREVRNICEITNNTKRAKALAKVQSNPLVQALQQSKNEGYGPRPTRFFHWQLEFPEVAFDEHGAPKDGFGFSAVVGNPPWDKIIVEKRHFYGPFSDEVANTQGASLNALITRLEKDKPELVKDWAQYEDTLNKSISFLKKSGLYRHQVATIGKKRSLGHPDLFKFFIERASQCAGTGGNIGYLVPCTLWQAEGCTGLRRYLFDECTLQSLYTFENYRKWAFSIDSRFKFTAVVFKKEPPKKRQEIPAAFMLREPDVLFGGQPERVLPLTREFVDQISPETLALLDVKNDGERALVEKLHSTPHLKPLGDPENGWAIRYQQGDLNMTTAAWLFKNREWMQRRGFTRVLPVRQPDGTWKQEITGPGKVAGISNTLPEGGEYWVAASDKFYQSRGYQQREGQIHGQAMQWYIHPEDIALASKKGSRFTEDHFRIFPTSEYTALYEGRMVHNFDHAQKQYISGEGRKAIWSELVINNKFLRSRVFVSPVEATVSAPYRMGFLDVTGATNERTSLGAAIGPHNIAGHKVPFLILPDSATMLAATAIFNSFVYDYLIRMRVSNSMTWNFLSMIPSPFPKQVLSREFNIQEQVLQLSCTTPELAPYWNEVFPDKPWTYDSAERDLWKRAVLRAEIDAIVADLYGLTVPEYARILTTFPLLDRDHPPLPGDLFLTEGDTKTPKKRRLDTPHGIFDTKPRSFITRDFALLTYMQHKGYPVPEHLDEWFRDEVGLDPEGPLSRFRIGEIKDLEARVEEARSIGAIPYLPTTRGNSG